MKYPASVIVALLAFAGYGAGQAGAVTPTMAEVDAIYPGIETFYIDLHRNPELAFQEVRTAGKLAEFTRRSSRKSRKLASPAPLRIRPNGLPIVSRHSKARFALK